MKGSELRTRVKALALHIIAVCDEVDTRKGRGVLVNQIVRSATSIDDVLKVKGSFSMESQAIKEHSNILIYEIEF